MRASPCLLSFALASALRILLALAAALGSTTAFRAAYPPQWSGAGATRPDPAPPHLPDRDHVANGCHLSTLAYLARFSAAYPRETAEPLVITVRGQYGRRHHTVALVSWHGRWWFRDEFFGVFPSHQRVTEPSDRAALGCTAARQLERQAGESSTRHRTPRCASAQGREAVTLAERVLPVPSRQFRLHTKSGEIAGLVFRPQPHQVAVYIPRHGTCLAECAIDNDADAVAAFALRLGYKVSAVTLLP